MEPTLPAALPTASEILGHINTFAFSPLGSALLAFATLIGGIAVILLWGATMLSWICGLWAWLRAARLPPPPPRRIEIGTLSTGRTVIGREADVTDLHKLLTAGAKVALINSGVVLKGQGGVGKSALARRYAEVHGTSYHAVFWSAAGSRQALVEGLCGVLGLTIPDQATKTHAKAAKDAIQMTGLPWLVVLDNIEARAEIEGLVPSGAHVIVTTRAGEGWAGWQVRQTDALAFDRDDSAAVLLLMQTAGRNTDATAARRLAEVLGGLPLGLVVMGSLIAAHGGS